MQTQSICETVGPPYRTDERIEKSSQARNAAHLVESLPSMNEALGSLPSPRKTGHASTHLLSQHWRDGSKKIRVQSHPRVPSEFKACLGYLRL